jgi:hypothetical protein
MSRLFLNFGHIERGDKSLERQGGFYLAVADSIFIAGGKA